MISFLKRLFESDTAPVATEFDTRIAACALLIALAEADGEVAKAETATILKLLQREHGLGAREARELLARNNTAHLGTNSSRGADYDVCVTKMS